MSIEMSKEKEIKDLLGTGKAGMHTNILMGVTFTDPKFCLREASCAGTLLWLCGLWFLIVHAYTSIKHKLICGCLIHS